MVLLLSSANTLDRLLCWTWEAGWFRFGRGRIDLIRVSDTPDRFRASIFMIIQLPFNNSVCGFCSPVILLLKPNRTLLNRRPPSPGFIMGILFLPSFLCRRSETRRWSPSISSTHLYDVLYCNMVLLCCTARGGWVFFCPFIQTHISRYS